MSDSFYSMYLHQNGSRVERSNLVLHNNNLEIVRNIVRISIRISEYLSSSMYS
jgi:hypothetical protein